MKMEQTECSEMSAFKIQMPGNYPEEIIQHSKHGESLKSRKLKDDCKVETTVTCGLMSTGNRGAHLTNDNCYNVAGNMLNIAKAIKLNINHSYYEVI